MGLPAEMVHRHPFRGVGVRMLGEVTQAAADTLRQMGWYEKTSQVFAVFLPVKSVG